MPGVGVSRRIFTLSLKRCGSYGTQSSLCGFVLVQKSRLELSFGRGTQPGSSRKGRRRSGQVVILREASRFGLACAPGSSRV